MRVGILAIQGDVEAHAKALEGAGAEAVPVLRERDLDGIEALPELLVQNMKLVDGDVVLAGFRTQCKETGLHTLEFTRVHIQRVAFGLQDMKRLAQLGSRLVLGTTRKLVDEFFENFVRDLAARAERVTAPTASQAKPTIGHRTLVLISVGLILLAWLAWWLFGPGTAE